MRRRALLVSLLLLGLPLAVADAAEPWEERAARFFAHAASPHDTQPVETWRVSLDLETVGGSARSSPFFSSLLTLHLHAPHQLGFGVALPFEFGVQPGSSCYGDMCGAYPSQAFFDFGTVALFAAWEPELGPSTRLPVGLQVLTTVPRFARGMGASVLDRLLLGATTRGLEDLEYAYPSYVTIVPKVGLLQEVGRVELAAAAKFPIIVTWTLPHFVWVGTTHVMVRLIHGPPGRFSVGVGAIGVVWASVSDPADGRWTLFSAAIEPRVHARVGGFDLRAGFLMPVAYGAVYGDAKRAVSHFPDAWGVRLGVGYSF